MNQDLLEIALLEELRTQKRMRLLNIELYEQFNYAFNYVMGVAERNHISLPNREAMLSCLKRMEELTGELSPGVKHPTKYPDYEAEPPTQDKSLNKGQLALDSS